MKKYTVFISDIHLNESQPAITRRFLQFLHHNAETIDTLYLLGDIFDYWIGDDHHTLLTQQVSNTLSRLAECDTSIYFIHGNRDYLLGKKFAQACGMRLLPEKTKIDLYGTTVLLMHGDLLCTKDSRYQWYRKIMFSAWMKKLAITLPLWLRCALAKKLRRISQGSNQKKTMSIMDVTEKSVTQHFAQYAVNLLIHGHTHHEKTELYYVEQAMKTRMVLGAWSDAAGCAIVATATQKPRFICIGDNTLLDKLEPS